MFTIPFVQISSVVPSGIQQPIFSSVDAWPRLFKNGYSIEPYVGLIINKDDIHTVAVGLDHVLVDFQLEIISVEILGGLYSLIMNVLMADDAHTIYKLGQ